MQKELAWKTVACNLALLVVFCSPSWAGTIDDPDPVGNTVHVEVTNGSALAQRITVEISVTLEGSRTAVSTQGVSVPANGNANVVAIFARTVSSIIAVGITEGPDPIPQ